MQQWYFFRTLVKLFFYFFKGSFSIQSNNKVFYSVCGEIETGKKQEILFPDIDDINFHFTATDEIFMGDNQMWAYQFL